MTRAPLPAPAASASAAAVKGRRRLVRATPSAAERESRNGRHGRAGARS